jgi:hypothetical protein
MNVRRGLANFGLARLRDPGFGSRVWARGGLGTRRAGGQHSEGYWRTAIRLRQDFGATGRRDPAVAGQAGGPQFATMKSHQIP